MFEALEVGAGLEVVLWLQSFENPFFNALAELFAQLGGDFGYLILLPIIYWSVDKRLGRWLLVVLTMALFVIIGAKELFGRPRPYILMGEQVQLLISEADGFGFPSGHVGLSTAIWGFVVLWVQRRWAWIVLAVYILVMAWARMYGGVHYPQDVVGGFLLGGAVALGIYTGRTRLLALWSRIPTAAAIALIVAVGALMAILLAADDAGVSAAGILIGGSLGLMLEVARANFAVAGGTVQRVGRVLLGLIATFVVFIVLDLAFEALTPAVLWRVVRYAAVTFVILGVWPLVIVRTRLASGEATA